MSFSVTILGSSSAKPTLSRHPSAQAVNVHEQYYLVDAGEGVQQQLIRCGINPLKLRAVFSEPVVWLTWRMTIETREVCQICHSFGGPLNGQSQVAFWPLR